MAVEPLLETPMPFTPIDLEKLQTLTRPELLLHWTTIYGEPPPIPFQRARLIRGILYKEQVSAEPTLKQAEKALRKQLGKVRSSGRSSGHTRLHPGARLLREWNGKTHDVTVTESGFTYRNQSYKSLSAIARLITGTRWSGPAFFGLVT